MNLPRYLDSLICITVLLCIASIMIIVRRELVYFPFLSVFLIWLTLFLYVFAGSGYEVNTSGLSWLLPFSIFIHGYNGHINGNLIYFAILSVLFETFVKIKGKNIKKDLATWYLIALFSPTLLSISTFLKQANFGFGLSFSIEIGTWTLWAYIIHEYHEVVKNRICVLMAILSGVPSVVFLEWFVQYFLGYTKDPYNNSLAIWHIAVGIASGIVVLVIVFGRKIARIFNLQIQRALHKITQLATESICENAQTQT